MHLFLYGVLVFLVAFVAGLIAIGSIKLSKSSLSLFLAFSGSYLFTITIVHILPEVFDFVQDKRLGGIYVILGFFLQQVLEFFSAGVEHGHMHAHEGDHKHTRSFIFTVVLALSVHSVLEGTLLTDPHGDSIFLGILIHKAPAAFALVSVLVCHISSRLKVILLLLVFALASPLGMTLSLLWGGVEVQPILYGLVAGSFLQISTTIVFETSADHKFNLYKLLISLMGAMIAVLSELFLL